MHARFPGIRPQGEQQLLMPKIVMQCDTIIGEGIMCVILYDTKSVFGTVFGALLFFPLFFTYPSV